MSLVIPPRSRDLGDGMMVRRALPFVHKRTVGPFIFWDHMGPLKIEGEREMIVRAHPHIGLATLTYLFSGEILHRDTLGNELLIRAGEVNWMIAGQGIAHSERSGKAYGQEGMTLEGIQLWIALPVEAEEVPPSFVHFDRPELPRFGLADVQWTLIAGRYQGYQSPVPVHSELFYFEAPVAAGVSAELPMHEAHEGALYVAQGEVEVDGQVYGEGHLIVQDVGDAVSFKVLKAARLLVFGGRPLPEPRHIWWNFVSSSKERIERAKLDWQAQRMGKVINEAEGNFIPLPPV